MMYFANMADTQTHTKGKNIIVSLPSVKGDHFMAVRLRNPVVFMCCRIVTPVVGAAGLSGLSVLTCC